MVGSSRSTGCATCVQRRVKCGEEKPSCGNCIKHGVNCPGYDRGLIFVTARTHRRKRPGATASLSSSHAVERSKSPSSSNIADALKLRSSFPDKRRPELNNKAPALQLIQNPDANDGQLLGVVIEKMFRIQPQTEPQFWSRAFTFLPYRLGNSRLLDSAIRCFALHHVGKMNDDERLVQGAKLVYVESLARLQRALNHQREWCSSETLSAAMIMCMYEMFVCTTSYEAWMRHASGIARLAQLRGPEMFMNPFDHTIFISLRGFWQMDALFSGKACFLADPKWQKVTVEQWDFSICHKQHILMEDICNTLSIIPALVRDAVKFRDAGFCGHTDSVENANLTNRALELYYRFKPWYEDWVSVVELPVDVPSRTNDPLFPIVSEYSDYVVATATISYFALILILHQVLRTCQYPQDFSVENAELVYRICKAVEYNGQGPLGPLRMAFPLRIAMDVADPEIKAWIVTWLASASKSFAVTSPKNYPGVEEKPPLSIPLENFTYEDGTKVHDD